MGIAGIWKLLENLLAMNKGWEGNEGKEVFGKLPPLHSLRHSTTSSPFDVVYIDINQFLHVISKKCSNEVELHNRLGALLDSILHYTQVKKKVFIAVDGPAPTAKLLTQIKRRETKSKKANQMKERLEKLERRKKGESGEESFEEKGHVDSGKGEAFGKVGWKSKVDPVEFTPGSQLMRNLDNYLLYYILNKLNQRRYRHLNFLYSGSEREGEGEFKIFQDFRHSSNSSDSSDGIERVGIVSSDGDVALFSLLAASNGSSNLQILRLFERETISISSLLLLLSRPLKLPHSLRKLTLLSTFHPLFSILPNSKKKLIVL